jgi:hypothetical protein
MALSTFSDSEFNNEPALALLPLIIVSLYYTYNAMILPAV